MADSLMPENLGKWLSSLGAPDNLLGMLPQELRDLDVSSVLGMLGSLGVETTTARPESEEGSESIRWLPILRD
ncbi:MAG: hypothetical protein K9G05_07630 [Candidatus Nanopelagicales bacterium]|nr:hypothetical protein [Candidatus Nanopelagicales bacterium]MCF8551929.1 hypothetical protein [Candidatus Nanopelagicales bacterium]